MDPREASRRAAMDLIRQPSKVVPAEITGRNGKWEVRRRCAKLGRGPFRVEARHPVHGFLLRGWVRSVGVEGHAIRWSVQDSDHNQLPDVVGDYTVAERTLLEATAELDGEPSLTEEAAAILARAGRNHAHNMIHNNT